MDRMTTEAAITATVGLQHPRAYSEVLLLFASILQHASDNESVTHALFRADPIPTLVRVLQVRTQGKYTGA